MYYSCYIYLYYYVVLAVIHNKDIQTCDQFQWLDKSKAKNWKEQYLAKLVTSLQNFSFSLNDSVLRKNRISKNTATSVKKIVYSELKFKTKQKLSCSGLLIDRN